jgi:hypothetical protein
MGHVEKLNKRLNTLEARQTSSSVPDDRWPPQDCDPARRLARYASYFDVDRPWECTGTPERRAKREADLTRYQDYFEFEDQEAGDEGQS